MVNTEAEALELKSKLETGADFGALAAQYSSCPSKAKGGSLGNFRPGRALRFRV